MIPKIPLQRGIRMVNLQLIGEMFGGVEKVRIHKSRREYGLIVYVSAMPRAVSSSISAMSWEARAELNP